MVDCPFKLDNLGAEQAVKTCDWLVVGFGERFAAPALIRDIAPKGETSYGRFAPAAQGATLADRARQTRPGGNRRRAIPYCGRLKALD